MAKFFWNYLNIMPSFMPMRLTGFHEIVQLQDQLHELKCQNAKETVGYNFILFAEHSSTYPIPPPRGLEPDFNDPNYIAYVKQFFQSDARLPLEKLFKHELPGDKSVAYMFENDSVNMIELYPLDFHRGGSITFHGPGQLVCYLILNLQEIGIKFAQVHMATSNAMKSVLAQLGVQGYTLGEIIQMSDAKGLEYMIASKMVVADTQSPSGLRQSMSANGVWTIDQDGKFRKLASLGLREDRIHGTTKWGFALNISTDLFYFDQIYPCGLDISMTSVEELTGKRHKLVVVAKMLAQAIVEEIKILSGNDSHILV